MTSFVSNDVSLIIKVKTIRECRYIIYEERGVSVVLYI